MNALTLVRIIGGILAILAICVATPIVTYTLCAVVARFGPRALRHARRMIRTCARSIDLWLETSGGTRR